MLARLLLGIFTLFYTNIIMAIEEPSYTIIEQSDDFELRSYDSKIIAEVMVEGSMDKASNAGFKLIANYIFGNNTKSQGGNEKISMTAPVTVELQSDKTSMTNPISMTKKDGQWRVHFVMPSQYTLNTLPKPNKSLVSLRELPKNNYAVICFSGFVGEDKVAKKTAYLLAWLNAKGITPIGKPQLARYNPPWTLPFLRRNEIMVAY